MARLLPQQGPCRLAHGRQTATRSLFPPASPVAVCAMSSSRTTRLATHPVDVEQERCSTSSAALLVQDERHIEQITSSTMEAPSTSGSLDWGSRAALVALASGLSLVLVDAAWASGGTLSGGAFDLFKDFLDQVEAMGPAGGLVFVVVVMLSEMIPLFPTQPLSLASGLIFGGKQGALLMLAGVTLAAINAFVISRGVGRPLAEKVISMEMGEEEGDSPSAATHNAVARKLAEVQRTIETGSFWQQLIAVALLRLTPIVPFSASNYVLGLTPLQLPAFIGGTVAGMSVWAVLYASLGGAGRSLLESGVDLGTVFAEMAAESGAYTRPVLLAAGGLAGAAALVYLVGRQRGGDSGADGNGAATGGQKREQPSEAQLDEDRGVVVREERLLRK